MTEHKKRYVGLDIHKDYVIAAVVDRDQTPLMKPRRIASSKLEGWVAAHLTMEDEVALEATSGSWLAYDMLVNYVGRVVVTHPYHVKLIAASFVKTDKRDAQTLARLLAANILPEVWVPPQHVRELRALLAHRRHLIQERSAAKNRLRAMLKYHHLQVSGKQVFDADWWTAQGLACGEVMRARHEVARIAFTNQQLAEVEHSLAQLSVSEHWIGRMPYLLQLPGVGIVIAMTILSAVGDVTRFPTAKKLVGYAGLGARVHASGGRVQSGGITKQGRVELRTAMITAAWVAVLHDAHWQEKFNALAARMSRQKAITVIARKMLVVVWQVLSERRIDREADDERIARSMMDWAKTGCLPSLINVPRSQFVRDQLDRLGIGRELREVTFCGRIYQLPPCST